MVLTDLITEFGAYYIAGSQNESRLIRQLRSAFGTAELFRTVVTDDTLYRAAESQMTRVVQPFQKAWTPTGALTFLPVAIQNFKMKVDHEEYPDDIEATWLGFLADQGLDRKEWPLVRYYVENELIPQIQEDIELNEIFSGVYAAPTPGTPGAAGTSMDGIKEIRNAHITAGRITPITIGAISTDPETFVGQVEAFADALPTKYYKGSMTIAMSMELERRYKRGVLAKYGVNTNYVDGARSGVDATNLMVKGVESHDGSDIIWTTPPQNAIRLVKKSANFNRIQLEAEDRKVKAFTDFWTGVGFLIPEIVFTNDSELPV